MEHRDRLRVWRALRAEDAVLGLDFSAEHRILGAFRNPPAMTFGLSDRARTTPQYIGRCERRQPKYTPIGGKPGELGYDAANIRAKALSRARGQRHINPAARGFQRAKKYADIDRPTTITN
jgi:hypothetical protein